MRVGDRFLVTLHSQPSRVFLPSGDFDAGIRIVDEITEQAVAFRYGDDESAGWVSHDHIRETPDGFEVWVADRKMMTYVAIPSEGAATLGEEVGSCQKT